MQIPHHFQDILRVHLPFADAAGFQADDDLAMLGLDSMAVVSLLADIEAGYGLTVPDDLLDEDTFATVGTLWLAVADLLVRESAQ
ncbi:phosphopantetheine-binding protein [Actinokineospora sp. 24-640]